MKQVHAIVISTDVSSLKCISDTLEELGQETHTGASLEEVECLLNPGDDQLDTLIIMELPSLPVSDVQAIVDRVFSYVASADLLLVIDDSIARFTHVIGGSGFVMYLRKPITREKLRKKSRCTMKLIIEG